MFLSNYTSHSQENKMKVNNNYYVMGKHRISCLFFEVKFQLGLNWPVIYWYYYVPSLSV